MVPGAEARNLLPPHILQFLDVNTNLKEIGPWGALNDRSGRWS